MSCFVRRSAIALCVLFSVVSQSAIAGTQTGLTSSMWGLDRVDQRLGTDTTYTYDATGENTIIYIVDEGVSEVPGELSGRILRHRKPSDLFGGGVIRFQNIGADDGTDRPASDHGTKVASIAAGATYGVAKSAKIIDYRMVENGSPKSGNCVGSSNISTPCFLFALQDIADYHQAQYPNMKGVVNLSGTIGTYSPDPENVIGRMRTAIETLISRGLTVVVAATEYGSAACGTTPAKFGHDVNGSITVSAIEMGDRLALSEDPQTHQPLAAGTGPCVDIFAPTETATVYGHFEQTSAATPFVSGAAALMYDQYPWMSPGQVEDQLKNNATRNVLENIPAGTVNALLYTRTPFAVTLSAPSFLTGQNGSASIQPISGATYAWTVMNGTIIGSSTGPSVSFFTGCPGQAQVRITVTVNGQSTTEYASTAVLASTARISSPNTTINYGQSTTLSLVFTGTGPWTVTWQDGLQQTYNTYNATRTVTPLDTTTYRFLSVRDGAGCSGTVSGLTTVTVYGGCSPANATVSTPSTTYASGVQFASVADTGNSYAWTVTNGSILSGQGTNLIQYYVGCSGTTTVSATITKSCGTQSTGSASVSIIRPTAVASGSQTIYSGQTATIQATYTGTYGGWITWSDFEQQFNLCPGCTVYRDVTPSTTTTYTIIEVRDNRGCFGIPSGSATVTVH